MKRNGEDGLFGERLVELLKEPITDADQRRVALVLCLVWFGNLSVEEVLTLEVGDYLAETGEVRAPKLELIDTKPRKIARQPICDTDTWFELPEQVCGLCEDYIRENLDGTKILKTKLFSPIARRATVWREIQKLARWHVVGGGLVLTRNRQSIANILPD